MAKDRFPESGRFPRESDVSPEATPTVTKYNQDWGLQPSEKGSDDLGCNPNNHPVPLKKGDTDPNGWQHEVFDVFPESAKAKR